MFGPRVGFLKFKASVTDHDGSVVPSIVFMRGAAVAILMILRCDEDGEQYTILTVQSRFPTGKHAFPDIPAGMTDGDGNFGGVAAKELEEETGIKVNVNDLIDLTELSIDQKGEVAATGSKGVYPSCGGCDEYLRLYAYRNTMPKAKIMELEGKLTGVAEEGEKIVLKLISIHDLWKSADAKSLAALCIYENLIACRKLPAWEPRTLEKTQQSERERNKERVGRLGAPSGAVL